MAEELPSLQIDTDWKKQAQEEKKRLAEKEQSERERRAAQPAPPSATPGIVAPPGAAPAGATATAARTPAARGQREVPPATLATLISNLHTQAMIYLGEYAMSGMEPTVNLDRAKQQVDMLTMLEEKTRGNVTDEEQRLLDTVLYEVRARFVSVASQYL